MTTSPRDERARPQGRLEELTADECRTRLAHGAIGRVVFVDARGPVALPVNYRVLDGDVVFRTATFSSLLASAYVDRVGFEVDEIDERRRQGWSVLATGSVRAVTDPAELAALEQLDVKPWAEGPRPRYLRITVRKISGRRLVAASGGAGATETP